MSIVKRSFVYATRFFAVISLLVVLFAVWVYCLRESTLSLWWHLTHGNQTAFQGHTITLPLMWRVDQSRDYQRIQLSRAYVGSWLTDGLGIFSPSPDKTGVFDDASALSWQNEAVARLGQNKTMHVSPEILHGKSLKFYCFGDQVVGSSCKVSGTDWLVLFGGRLESQQEAKDILKSMK